jgi:BON domain
MGMVWAQQDPATSGQQPADNTNINQRDRNQNEPTADQQKENSSDRALAQQVRQALVKDKSLSAYAHHIKVIALNGIVTLKGQCTLTRKNKRSSPRLQKQGQSLHERVFGSRSCHSLCRQQWKLDWP